MFQTARPVAAPTPQQTDGVSCPRCGTPVTGIAATEPGRHEFVDCGHGASARAMASLTLR
ncbi:MAG: hypothetical protein U5J98_06530 [Halobacteriales archaeon]|nr:hypothetical protein [Halobacteriales archaeon]